MKFHVVHIYGTIPLQLSIIYDRRLSHDAGSPLSAAVKLIPGESHKRMPNVYTFKESEGAEQRDRRRNVYSHKYWTLGPGTEKLPDCHNIPTASPG